MLKKAFRKIGMFFHRYGKLITTWTIILGTIAIGIYFKLDEKLIAVLVLLFGVLGHAFAGLAVIVATIPFIGPIVVRVISLPIFWLLNALGYFVSVLAIKKGYGRNVVNYRVVTIVFLIGIIVGFIFGRIF